ncbi:unnamed protein product [Anisakis simplex]|uniref:Uncharacterized protein n=1 Tax=Anisakis simplex TaxID=6269 RepID=A0A3P6R8A1_ANISI|nr:unnamed protein product [Anisakis simplex]
MYNCNFDQDILRRLPLRGEDMNWPLRADGVVQLEALNEADSKISKSSVIDETKFDNGIVDKTIETTRETTALADCSFTLSSSDQDRSLSSSPMNAHCNRTSQDSDKTQSNTPVTIHMSTTLKTSYSMTAIGNSDIVSCAELTRSLSVNDMNEITINRRKRFREQLKRMMQSGLYTNSYEFIRKCNRNDDNDNEGVLNKVYERKDIDGMFQRFSSLLEKHKNADFNRNAVEESSGTSGIEGDCLPTKTVSILQMTHL